MKRKLPTRAVCDRYGVCDRTVDRWVDAGILPPPDYINGRRYFDEEEMDRRDRERRQSA